MNKNEKIMHNVIGMLSNPDNLLLYVLTAVTNAIQERLGEDIQLKPRSKVIAKGQGGEANVLTVEINGKRTHFLYYGPPKSYTDLDELLDMTLDVAHELGHLILQGNPGKLPPRSYLSKIEINDICEVECDWFAVCILQMYGFLYPPLL